jgi:adenosylcobinamide kinase/adenosylcobinamide-phosphate guanylyltransferase
VLIETDDSAAVDLRVDALVAALERPGPTTILVTNEVGLGIVPDNALARAFRDVAGRANQRIASVATELYFATMGVVLRLRPGPVEGVS